MFYHIKSLCVSIIFISHPVFMKAILLYQSNDISLQFSCVLFSRRDIHPINNIQYFKLMQTFMLAGVVSQYCYFRNIIFTKYRRHAVLSQFNLTFYASFSIYVSLYTFSFNIKYLLLKLLCNLACLCKGTPLTLLQLDFFGLTLPLILSHNFHF